MIPSNGGIQSFLTRLLLVGGAVLTSALFVFVRPPSGAVEGRTNVQLWRVVGADEKEAPSWEWFNESQDDIHVRKIGLPFLEIEQKFLTAAVGGVPPDVFEYFGSVAQWSTRGALMPLDDFMERDGFDREGVFPALWDEMTWNGQTYAVPVGTASEAFYWNKEHFRRAGLDPDRPPQTWKELREYALKLTTRDENGDIEQAGYIPGYWSPFGAPLFLNWAIQKGAVYLGEDGTSVNLTSSAAIDALAWEAELFEELGRDALIRKRGSFGFGSQHGFLSGQLSMIVQKSSFIQEIEKFASDMEYGVSILPVPQGGSPGVTAGPAWIGIPSGAAHAEEAWEYIKFVSSTPAQLRVAQFAADHNLVVFFPANMEAANSPQQQSLPHMDVFIDSMAFARSSTVVPLAHTVFWREYGNAWDRAIRGSQTAEEALGQAEREVQRALNEQLEYNRFYRDYLAKQQHADKAGGGQ